MSRELKERELLKRLFALSSVLEFTQGLKRLDPLTQVSLGLAAEEVGSSAIIEKYNDESITDIEIELLTELATSFLKVYQSYIEDI